MIENQLKLMLAQVRQSETIFGILEVFSAGILRTGRFTAVRAGAANAETPCSENSWAWLWFFGR